MLRRINISRIRVRLLKFVSHTRKHLFSIKINFTSNCSSYSLQVFGDWSQNNTLFFRDIALQPSPSAHRFTMSTYHEGTGTWIKTQYLLKTKGSRHNTDARTSEGRSNPVESSRTSIRVGAWTKFAHTFFCFCIKQRYLMEILIFRGES